MGGQVKGYLTPAQIDVGMMVGSLREKADSVNESEGRGKILKLESALDLLALVDPFGQ